MLKGKGILSDFQQAFLKLFASLPDQERFYLTGGTALAEYYLGHRFSFDLDLFTSEAELILPFSYRLEKTFQASGLQVLVLRRFASFVELQVSRRENTLFPDEIERWPVKMLVDCDPVEIKRTFRNLAL